MGERFLRRHIIRLSRLLDMMYKPSEIADEIEMTTETIYRSHLPAGAPFERDSNDNIWIHGTDFARWAETIYKKRKKCSLEDGEAWCCKCNAAREMVNPRGCYSNRYIIILQGKCTSCSSKVNRIYANNDEGRALNFKRARPGKTPRVGQGEHENSGMARRAKANGMILRENWLETKEFLKQLERKDRDRATILQARRCLRHLLEWAREKPFGLARSIDPTFANYLLTARNDGRPGQLSVNSMDKICQYSRAFFDFIRGEHPTRYRQISRSWIETVRPGAKHGLQTEYKEHQFYTLEMMRRLAAVKVTTLRQERDRAAACFLYLSAMRAQAFASLTMRCVDMNSLKVSQFPGWGVMTKGRKSAKTTLLREADLLEVVRAWDAKLRAAGMTETDLWFPVLTHLGEIGHQKPKNYANRRTDISKGVRWLCDQAKVPYLSLHKFRHGHAVLMMRRAKNMKHIDSLRANLMHENVAITTGIYAKLVNDDLEDTYAELGE